MRKLMLLSNSILHGSGYLEYAKEAILEFFKKNNVQEVLFVPYADVHSEADYTKRVREELGKWGFAVKGLDEFVDDPVAAVLKAQCIFIGGGNTFHLLKKLQDSGLIEPIRKRVLQEGVPYMGSSAGTNVATISINTTNDMPIVYPSSFQALGLVPFNINPHYIPPEENRTHMGETRDERISEYHKLKGIKVPPVLGMREGTFLSVEGDKATLGGHFPAKLFLQGEETKEFPIGADLSFLLKV